MDLMSSCTVVVPFWQVHRNCGRGIVVIVYLSMLLDNILLTVLVPIIPDFLIALENDEYLRDRVHDMKDNETLTAVKLQLAMDANLLDVDSENGRAGLLLSSKAMVQILLNPVVGTVTARLGYHLPLLFGTFVLLASSTLFAIGGGFVTLLLARSLQGVASSCIGITGMCLVAERYPTEPDRSKMMGFVLGSVAIGVLIGYPLGGFLYDVLGKSAPFLVVSALISIDCGLQLYFLDLKADQGLRDSTRLLELFSDNVILLTGGAIGISTSAMAILEPCLPLWLLKEIKPKKWQLGTAFIPDSVGYVLGTNCIGMIAYHLDRFKMAMLSIVLVGISSVFIPMAKTMTQLVVPHFLLGFGIGAVDAALVPLLAALMDARHSSHYVSVYAMQQMAVSLAYFFGPIIGGSLVRSIGFPWLMRIIGFINVMYSPMMIVLRRLFEKNAVHIPRSMDFQKHGSMAYQSFSDSDAEN